MDIVAVTCYFIAEVVGSVLEFKFFDWCARKPHGPGADFGDAGLQDREPPARD